MLWVMVHISDEQFEQLVEQAVARIPRRFAEHLENVAFMVADEPSREQLAAGGILHGRAMLLGLYEGVPLPARSGNYSGVAPDVITVFRRPHEMMARDEAELARAVHQTVWHEVAHYFGLGHGAIRELEGRG
jgi:predicted Zn-dependent protease with MMP-like domain